MRVVHGDFRDYLNMPEWDNALVFSDPPYNQGYHYSQYEDELGRDEYAALMRAAFHGRRAVIIHYPEETINVLGPVLGACEQVVSWVYPSNTAKQSRLISWWGCRPDFTRFGQAYRNPKDKRIAARIAAGKEARLYDWWEVNQVKNVSKHDNPHPCPIPYEIARRVILTTTDPGDMVIDPFAGSGTIIRAAEDYGRRALGFEIDEQYVDFTYSRIF